MAMSGGIKSLQLLQSVFPNHIFLGETQTVVLGVYHRRGAHQTLYRVAESEESVPICVTLRDSRGDIINEGEQWTMSCQSESLEISAAKLTLKIVFHSLPQNQPLKFEFCAGVFTEDKITPFITEVFRVCRYELAVVRQPSIVYYKDDGGFRNNHLICGVRVLDHRTRAPVKGRRIPISCRLETENGKRLDFMTKRRTKRGKSKKGGGVTIVKVKYLMVQPNIPEIQHETGTVSFGVRINDVSQNHHNQQFVLVIEPDWANCPSVSDVWGVRTHKILVKSKSPEKLAHQRDVAQRRSSYKGASVDSGCSVSPAADESLAPPMSATSERGLFPPTVDDDSCVESSRTPYLAALSRQNSIASRSSSRRRSRKRRLDDDKPLRSDPSDLNRVPSERWFPARTSDHRMTDSAEASRALWMKQAFRLLAWREWICVGYQCQYLDPSLNSSCLLHEPASVIKSEKCTKMPGYKIVRCLLCGSEGAWTDSTKPTHKPSCSFKLLKDGFGPLRQECEKMGMWSDSSIMCAPPSMKLEPQASDDSATAAAASAAAFEPWPHKCGPPVYTPDAHLQASLVASQQLGEQWLRTMSALQRSKGGMPGLLLPSGGLPRMAGTGTVATDDSQTDATTAADCVATAVPMTTATTAATATVGSVHNLIPGLPASKRQAVASSLTTATGTVPQMMPQSLASRFGFGTQFSSLRLPVVMPTAMNTIASSGRRQAQGPKLEDEDTKHPESGRLPTAAVPMLSAALRNSGNIQPQFGMLHSPMVRPSPFSGTGLAQMLQSHGAAVPSSPFHLPMFGGMAFGTGNGAAVVNQSAAGLSLRTQPMAGVTPTIATTATTVAGTNGTNGVNLFGQMQMPFSMGLPMTSPMSASGVAVSGGTEMASFGQFLNAQMMPTASATTATTSGTLMGASSVNSSTSSTDTTVDAANGKRMSALQTRMCYGGERKTEETDRFSPSSGDSLGTAAPMHAEDSRLPALEQIDTSTMKRVLSVPT